MDQECRMDDLNRTWAGCLVDYRISGSRRRKNGTLKFFTWNEDLGEMEVTLEVILNMKRYMKRFLLKSSQFYLESSY